MKDFKFLLAGALFCSVLSCSKEAAEPSTVTKFQSFGFNMADKIEVEEGKLIKIPFTFDDNQIFDFDVEIHVDANTTATEDEDFHVETGLSIQALAKKGEFEFEALEDLFLEDNEKVFLTLSSTYPGHLPLTKTVEVTIKNVGGCPEFIQNDFVGDYTVVSDDWQDWKAGDVISVTNEGANVLAFKYNCGADALPILMKIDPATFGISGTKQEYCSYSLPPLTKFYGDIVEASSAVNTCEKSLSVTIAHSDANSTAYGSGKIVLKKN